jgi:hypothetical protein
VESLVACRIGPIVLALISSRSATADCGNWCGLSLIFSRAV